jgi:hypothetical protein
VCVCVNGKDFTQHTLFTVFRKSKRASGEIFRTGRVRVEVYSRKLRVSLADESFFFKVI